MLTEVQVGEFVVVADLSAHYYPDSMYAPMLVSEVISKPLEVTRVELLCADNQYRYADLRDLRLAGV